MVGRVSGPAADVYGALAPIYDDWQSCDGMIPFAELVRAQLEPVLRAEARRPRGISHERPFAFLDVACGTGTLLSGMRAEHPGWRLAGVDGSPAMLGIAARKQGGRGVAWGRSALDGPLPFGPTFDAVGCFYDALNHLEDSAALARAVAAMAAVLRPGGLLVFDVTNADGFARWWRGKPQFAGDGWRLSIEMQFDGQRQLGLADVAITLRAAPTSHFTLRERHFPRGAVLEALAAARLAPVTERPWAPFDGDLAGKTWWVARLDG
ncbi:MAG TPA: class I SAM-dependent methyltransferase [Polyangia bacterium]|nr:class I SAM-dependent methyltransferase [Polyangia bacterium]